MLRTTLFVLTLSTASALATAARAETCELPQPIDCLHRGLELMEAGDAASVAWFAKACESKLPDGCAQMGFLYMGSPVLAQDDAQAFAFSKRACDLGSGLGCKNAAVLTRDGRGTPADEAAMKKLAERSCKLERADGCFLMAAIVEEGLGGGGAKPDPKKANGWLEKACDYEDAHSCELLANRYLEGSHGAKQDGAKAAAKFERACALGSGEACNDLGANIGDGAKGFPKGGHAKALEMFTRGCELGHEKACNNAKLAAAAAVPASEGTTELALQSRSGKKVKARIAGGTALVVGAEGEVSKQVSQMGFTMDLVIGTVKVVKLTGGQAELEVVADQSEIVVDGKKVDHWTAGSALKLKWKAP